MIAGLLLGRAQEVPGSRVGGIALQRHGERGLRLRRHLAGRRPYQRFALRRWIVGGWSRRDWIRARRRWPRRHSGPSACRRRRAGAIPSVRSASAASWPRAGRSGRRAGCRAAPDRRPSSATLRRGEPSRGPADRSQRRARSRRPRRPPPVPAPMPGARGRPPAGPEQPPPGPRREIGGSSRRARSPRRSPLDLSKLARQDVGFRRRGSRALCRRTNGTAIAMAATATIRVNIIQAIIRYAFPRGGAPAVPAPRG